MEELACGSISVDEVDELEEGWVSLCGAKPEPLVTALAYVEGIVVA